MSTMFAYDVAGSVRELVVDVTRALQQLVAIQRQHLGCCRCVGRSRQRVVVEERHARLYTQSIQLGNVAIANAL